MKRKTITLRDKIDSFFFCVDTWTQKDWDKAIGGILRLIREDRQKHCAECQRVKTLIDKQIKKNQEIDK